MPHIRSARSTRAPVDLPQTWLLSTRPTLITGPPPPPRPLMPTEEDLRPRSSSPPPSARQPRRWKSRPTNTRYGFVCPGRCGREPEPRPRHCAENWRRAWSGVYAHQPCSSRFSPPPHFQGRRGCPRKAGSGAGIRGGWGKELSAYLIAQKRETRAPEGHCAFPSRLLGPADAPGLDAPPRCMSAASRRAARRRLYFATGLVEARARCLGHAGIGNRKDIRNAVGGGAGGGRMGQDQRAQPQRPGVVLYYIGRDTLSARRQRNSQGASPATLDRLHRRPAPRELYLCSSPPQAEVAAVIDRTLPAMAPGPTRWTGAVANVPIPRRGLAKREPVGVIGLLAPDESPLLGAICPIWYGGRPAIAMGNRVVLVPSQPYPLAARPTSTRCFDTSDLPGRGGVTSSRAKRMSWGIGRWPVTIRRRRALVPFGPVDRRARGRPPQATENGHGSPPPRPTGPELDGRGGAHFWSRRPRSRRSVVLW